AGLYLTQQTGNASRQLGKLLLWLAPYLMKSLGIAGTVAMFLVGGGILVHGIPAAHHWLEGVAHHAGALNSPALSLLTGLCGLLAGGILVGLYTLVKPLFGSKGGAH